MSYHRLRQQLHGQISEWFLSRKELKPKVKLKKKYQYFWGIDTVKNGFVMIKTQ